MKRIACASGRAHSGTLTLALTHKDCACWVQVFSLLSSWFWMFYLLIPAYGLYKLLVMVGDRSWSKRDCHGDAKVQGCERVMLHSVCH